MLLKYFHTIYFIFFIAFFPLNEIKFKGGKEALNQFFTQNIIYPKFSKNNCIQATIQVSFQLNSEGNVINTKIYKGLGIDLDDEAIRLVKLTSKKWDFDYQNIRNVVFIIPVDFKISKVSCETKSISEVNKAIAYYQTQIELEKNVFKFYENKATGKVNAVLEKEIENIKKDLGFDDQFIEESLKIAHKMIQQKDTLAACEKLKIIKKIGSNKADLLIAKFCK